MKKLPLAYIKALWPELLPPVPGNPNIRTKATKRGHIHQHRLSLGQERHAFYLAKVQGTK